MYFLKELDLYTLFVFASIFNFLLAGTLFVLHQNRTKSIPVSLPAAILLMGLSYTTHALELSEFLHSGLFISALLFIASIHFKTSALITIKKPYLQQTYLDLFILTGLTAPAIFFPAGFEIWVAKYITSVSAISLIYYTVKLRLSKLSMQNFVNIFFYLLYILMAVVAVSFVLLTYNREIEFFTTDTNTSERLFFVGYFLLEYFIILLLLYVLIEKTISTSQSFETNYHILKRELNHRFANSINQILSLIEISEADKIDNDEHHKKRLINRITTISEVHKKLYDTHEDDKVEVKLYLKDLVGKIIESFDFQNKVEITSEGDKIYLEEDVAVKIGLSFNELALNSCKYAFRGEREGKILIETSIENNATGEGDMVASICYSDNGPGYADKEVSKGFGKRLLEHMVMFLNADVEMDTNGSFTYKITFPYTADRHLLPDN